MSGFDELTRNLMQEHVERFRRIQAALMADVRRSLAPHRQEEAVETFYVAPIELHIPEEGDCAWN